MNSSNVACLPSIVSQAQVVALNQLTIFTVADLASYPPCRQAELLVGLERNGELDRPTAEGYLRPGSQPVAGAVHSLPITSLKSLPQAAALTLRNAFGIQELGQLAKFQPFIDAVKQVQQAMRPAFYEAPSAPPALLPTMVGSTQTTTRLSSYVKDVTYELAEYQLVRRDPKGEPEPQSELIEIFLRQPFKFDLGYLALIKQKWLNAGTHLGEIVHSLALAPGESRNIAVIDWMQRQRSSRAEDTNVSEVLTNQFKQTRAINEVVSTTAAEHLQGLTDVDATTKTNGFGVTGGTGGGKAQSQMASSALSFDPLALIGLPAPGANAKAAGSAGDLSSSAGGIGASYVHSKGTVQGTLMSETSGQREVLGNMTQNIADATVQNASNVRSTMSTVVVEDIQGGNQRSQTKNVTNYNHSHALTIQYYEVLQKYLVRTAPAGLTGMLFLPFQPLNLTIDLIQAYWDVFRRPMRQAFPARFAEYDLVVKDFDPKNNAFDPSSELVIDAITITRARTYSSNVKVELPDANPYVKFSFPGSNLDDSLSLSLIGGSTYVAYDVLASPTFSQNDAFGAQDDIPIDESVACKIKSTFKSALRREIKSAIDTAKKKADTNRSFNELGLGNNRDNLKDDVDDGKYSILNKTDGVTLDLDIQYTVKDGNGNVQVISQQHSATWTYNQLHGEIDEELFNASDYITESLSTTADINPLDTIGEIEAHFQFHKYGYTRYLLVMLEKEQLIDVIEHLRIQGGADVLALDRVIDPNPIGLVENFLIFKLRESSVRRSLGEDASPSPIQEVFDRYLEELKAFGRQAQTQVRSDTVYLPTAGVFGEAILGLSNASEYINLRRFFNWQDSPIPNLAPQILAVDLNQLRANPVAPGLTPTIADSTLSPTAPIQYALPTSLSDALQAVQNGSMFQDMSKTSDFAGILGNLSALASTSAQLAGNLSGEAMAKALDSAVALGGQIASLTDTAMRMNPAAPPDTLTAKGAQRNNIDDVAQTPTPDQPLSPVDEGRIETGGTSISPGTKNPNSTDSTQTSPSTSGGTDTNPTNDGVANFDITITVPYDSIRLDFARGATSAIPASVISALERPITFIANWVAAVGFDADNTTESITDALATLALAPTGVGEIIGLVEGLQAIFDFIGGEVLVSPETIDLVTGGLYDTITTLQTVMFPCISGGEWLKATLNLDVKNGQPIGYVNVPEGLIQYGFQSISNPVEDGPWWAGGKPGLLDSFSIYITSQSLSISTGIVNTDTLSCTVKSAIPLALDWISALGLCSDRVKQTIARLLAVNGMGDYLTSKGATVSLDSMTPSIDSWFNWWQDNFLSYLTTYFVPDINFEFNIAVAPTTGWTVTVTPKHDPFPGYAVTLEGRGDGDPTIVYSAATTSVLGPLALIGDALAYPPRPTVVPSAAIGDWR